jgi:hypothetical protein
MANPTPGPWTLKNFGGPQISGPEGYAVCTMWGAISASELAGQDLANARLIAAAPDLLAALEALVEGVDRLLGKPEPYECDDGALAAARAAILKATGGQQ